MKKRPFFDKAYLGHTVLYVSLTVLAIGALFYLGYHMTGNSRGGIDTMYAVSETVPRSVKGNAYIIRDEVPIDEDVGSGYLSPVARDGDKVRVGAMVAEVYASPSAAVSEKIALIEDQIAFYEKCISTHVTVGDTSNVHREISDSIIELRRRTAGGEVGSVAVTKPSLTLAVRRLGVLTGRVTDFRGQITALEEELARTKAGLGPVLNSVYAPSSGYYFSTVDGYESVFSAASIDSVTYSDVVGMISASENVKPNTASAGKIVSSFKWYAACKMTAAEAASFKQDYTYRVKLANNPSKPLDMKVHKVLSDSTDAVVLFECTNIPADYDFTRLQEFEAEYEELKTFKIPVSALRIHEDMQGVYILDEVTVKFRRVSVIDEENGFYLCHTSDPDEVETEDTEEETKEEETEENGTYYAYLRENDVVIKSGTGLYVGMTYNPSR